MCSSALGLWLRLQPPGFLGTYPPIATWALTISLTVGATLGDKTTGHLMEVAVAKKLLFGRGQPVKQPKRCLCRPLWQLCLWASTVLSSEERLENLVFQLELSLSMSWEHLLMRKSKEANWPCGTVHFNFWVWSVSKVSLSEVLESSSLSWKKASQLNTAKEFFQNCLVLFHVALFVLWFIQ